MAIQEAALYGDLVLALRDHAAARLATAVPVLDLENARSQIDDFIRAWLFRPQEQLYGSAPRDVIWREQLGEANPIPREYAAEAYSDCDCPICQMLREEIEQGEGQHCWTYSPDACLLDRYDPEGSEDRWRRELEQMTE